MRRWKVVAAVAAGMALGTGIAWATIPGAAANPGSTRPVIRFTTRTLHPGGAPATFFASCDKPEVATGGGWRLSGAVHTPRGTAPVTTHGDGPLSPSSGHGAGTLPVGWEIVDATNLDYVDHAVTVYAICAPWR
jgi:hypothetical protein